MNIHDYLDSIPNFDRLDPTSQVKWMCWYLTRHGNRVIFSVDDLVTCFVSADCPTPQHLPSICVGLVRMNPPFLLGQDGIPGSYKLTRLARQDYEAKYDPKPSTIVVDKQLTDLLPKLTDAEERGYLEEALACFRIKAYRAAIVMTWNVAYGHLCKVIINKKLAEFNQTLPRRLPNANRTVITKQEDLAEFKEFDVLAVARSADIIDKNAHKIWMHRLEDRNMAAHPNKVIFKQLEVEAFIHNLIENCFLPLKP